jgi:hypothetical protein
MNARGTPKKIFNAYPPDQCPLEDVWTQASPGREAAAVNELLRELHRLTQPRPRCGSGVVPMVE